jgi:menaquinone-9 beta-reductase
MKSQHYEKAGCSRQIAKQAIQIYYDNLTNLEDPMADLNHYDLAVVGGGIAGQEYGGAGARVLILEGANRFADRVRGEGLFPWGAAELERLGRNDCFAKAGARQLRWADLYMGAQQTEHRDFLATTLTRTPAISFYHPKMQTCLLEAAENAGADVRRGSDATAITAACGLASSTRRMGAARKSPREW